MVSVSSQVEDVYIAEKRRGQLTTAETPNGGKAAGQIRIQRRSNMDRAAKELWQCLLNESLDNLYG